MFLESQAACANSLVTSVDFFFLGRRQATYRTLANAAGIRTGHRVLDVGCGTGYFARIIAEEVGSAGRVGGVDPSETMIEFARQKARRLSNCDFQVGSAETLPFPDDRFDIVVSSLVMHHMPEDIRLRALQEMRRVLRPGGRLLVAEARSPRQGPLRLLARAHGFDRMAEQIPHLELLVVGAGFGDIETGEVPPWLRYATAAKF